MNTNFRRFALFLLFIAGFLFHCSTDTTPLSPYGTIDENLVGVWFYRDTISLGTSATEAIHGLIISKNGEILNLGAEWRTGRLSPQPRFPVLTILDASHGNMEVSIKGSWDPRIRKFSCKYKIRDGELFFADSPSSYFTGHHYHHSAVGEKVAAPVVTEFEVWVDSSKFVNQQVSSFPSAYLGFRHLDNDTVLDISASSDNSAFINIELKDFSGTGIYELGRETSGNAGYTVVNGDQGFVISTLEIPHAGSVTIENFDPANKRCSGTFNFQIGEMHFSNGRFDVPVY